VPKLPRSPKLKTKSFNHRGHEGTRREILITDQEEIAGIAVIGKAKPRPKPLTTEATEEHRGNLKIEKSALQTLVFAGRNR
jgi:hypothetical protein